MGASGLDRVGGIFVGEIRRGFVSFVSFCLVQASAFLVRCTIAKAVV